PASCFSPLPFFSLSLSLTLSASLSLTLSLILSAPLAVPPPPPSLCPLGSQGAMLRNTRWIYGIVVFTGHETKLMRNASATPIKRTSVERMTDVQIIFLFGILLIMSFACAIGNLVTQLRYADQLWYLMLNAGDQSSLTVQFIKNVLTFLILFNNLIPISLIVAMEVVKYQQAALINSDLDMYYEKTDTPALARTSSLVEELGQIEYIFSDKTGTLTCNIMEFRECIVAGVAYSEVVEEGKRPQYDADGTELPGGVHTFDELRENLRTHDARHVIDEFLTLLAVCHTVIPETNEDTGGESPRGGGTRRGRSGWGAGDVFRASGCQFNPSLGRGGGGCVVRPPRFHDFFGRSRKNRDPVPGVLAGRSRFGRRRGAAGLPLYGTGAKQMREEGVEWVQ
ncbi:MAG: hypothetical protein BJ554DRAFT_1314, partial [Olpidium bornovanus]